MSDSPSIREIAAQAGVSRTTVSDALRDRPTVAAKTKAHILRIAEEMGYQQDARVGELMSYLRERKSKREWIPVAWIHAQPTENLMHMTIWRQMYEGAEAKAKSLGFELNHYWLKDPEIKPKRLAQILHARGINGVIMSPPFNDPLWNETSWDRFFCVQISVDPKDKSHHSVVPDSTYAMQVIWENLQRSGYQRIALALKMAADHRVDGGFGAQYIWLAAPFIGQPEIPIFKYSPDEEPTTVRQRLANWLEQFHPDAIISNDGTIESQLNETGWPVPKKIGLALTNVQEGNERYSGATQANREIGAAAIDVLAAHLHYKGFAQTSSVSTQVKGSWNQGETILSKV